MKTRDFDQVMMTTRSVRRRLDFDRPVDRAVIEECVDIAVQAPTGANSESWRFFVLSDPEPKRVVADLYRRALHGYATSQAYKPKAAQQALADRMHEMPVLILVCSLGRPAPNDVASQVAFYGSVLPAAWSLMLALRSRGLGSTWTSLHLLHEAEAAKELGIPPDVTQTVLLPVGYMRDAKLRPASRHPAREVTYWNTWGDEASD